MSEELPKYKHGPVLPSFDGINGLSDRELIELDYMLFQIRNTPTILDEIKVVCKYIDKVRSERYKQTDDKERLRKMSTTVDPFPMLSLNDVQLMHTMVDIIIRQWDRTHLGDKQQNDIITLGNYFSISAGLKQKMIDQSENK